jgi:hypothetical protein
LKTLTVESVESEKTGNFRAATQRRREKEDVVGNPGSDVGKRNIDESLLAMPLISRTKVNT